MYNNSLNTKKTDKEVAMIFQQAANEIEQLRQRVSILQAKAEVIDVFKMALSGERPQAQGYTECLVWKLRKAAESILNNTILEDTEIADND